MGGLMIMRALWQPYELRIGPFGVVKQGRFAMILSRAPQRYSEVPRHYHRVEIGCV
jgi:hypothetical protein